MNKEISFFKKTAVVSFSGGMDSTCLVMHLLALGHEVYAYSFDYGQNHRVELERASKNAEYLRSLGLPVYHKIINLQDVFAGDPSTLVQHEKSPEGDYRSETMKATVVNNRNVIFSSVIFAKALSLAKQKLDNLTQDAAINQEKITKEQLRKEATVTISLGVHAGDHCFTKDTKILTPTGLKTVDTLKIGDELFSFDPDTETISLDKCLDIIPKGVNNEIYNISTTSGDIRLTSEHEVYVCDFSDYNKSKGYVKNITKKKVKDLQVDDYMISSYKMPLNLFNQEIHTINILDIFKKLDHHLTYVDGNKFGFIRDNGSKTSTYNIDMPAKEFVNLMAWYISEGYTSKPTNSSQSKYTSCFSQSMYKNLENCESILNDLKILNIPLSITESKIKENDRPKEVTYQFNSVISAIMQSCGCNSREKHIPNWLKNILYKSKDLRTSFIHTMCCGDGHFDEISGMWSYQSNSFQLIQDISELIKLNGFYVKLQKTNTKSHIKTITFGSKESKSGLIRIGDASVTKIKSINVDTSMTEKVYDISVEKNHNFFAGELGNLLISNSIYPDCTEESVNMARELFRISNWDSDLVKYDTPFVDCPKSGVLAYGLGAMSSLGLTDEEKDNVLSHTISCYNATEDGVSCGKCGTCVERLEAFKILCRKDPIPYANI